MAFGMSGWGDWGNTNNNNTSNNNENNNNSNDANSSGFSWARTSSGNGNGNNNNSNPFNNSNIGWQSNNSFSGNNNNNNNSNNSSNNTNGTSLNFTFPGSSPKPAFSKTDNRNVYQQLRDINLQYTSCNDQCRFQTVLYNEAPLNVAPTNARKPNNIQDHVWEQGIANNPDSKRLYPVAVAGYDALNCRSKICIAGHVKGLKKVDAGHQMIERMQKELETETKQKIDNLKKTQLNLSNRLLAVLRQYACQSVENQSGGSALVGPLGSNQNTINMQSLSLRATVPLSMKEMEMKSNLDRMTQECREMMTMYAQIGRLSSQMDLNQEMHTMGNVNDHLDPKSMKQMFEFLKQQQAFIQLLAHTMQSDIKDLDIIREGRK